VGIIDTKNKPIGLVRTNTRSIGMTDTRGPLSLGILRK